MYVIIFYVYSSYLMRECYHDKENKNLYNIYKYIDLSIL